MGLILHSGYAAITPCKSSEANGGLAPENWCNGVKNQTPYGTKLAGISAGRNNLALHMHWLSLHTL